MAQYKDNFKLHEKVDFFAMSMYTLIKPFGSLMKWSCLSYQKDKKNKDCGHTRDFMQTMSQIAI